MAVGDLTTVANVKAWRTPPIAATSDDDALGREVSAASLAVLRAINRKSLALASYVETRNGQGTCGMKLRNYPLVAVTSVVVCAQAIPARPANAVGAAGSYGYSFDPEDGMVYLNGYLFPLGTQNVTFAYAAGYAETDLGLEIDSGDDEIACEDLSKLWASDGGVVYSGTTTKLVAVKADPAQGQYVPPDGPSGAYEFNSADASSEMDITYGFTPRDVEEAVINAVILEYNRRGRIGENSKVLAGENVTYYESAAFNKTTEQRLRHYVNVVPNP